LIFSWQLTALRQLATRYSSCLMWTKKWTEIGVDCCCYSETLSQSQDGVGLL